MQLCRLGCDHPRPRCMPSEDLPNVRTENLNFRPADRKHSIHVKVRVQNAGRGSTGHLAIDAPPSSGTGTEAIDFGTRHPGKRFQRR